MKEKIYTVILLTSTLFMPWCSANAALGINRTRIIYNEGEKSVSINVKNNDTKKPYLAQGWLENIDDVKITGPLIVLPPLQRIEPDASTAFRIQSLPDIDNLPKDRESVFFINIREIPPKTNAKNTLNLALQSRLKVFYRPKRLHLNGDALTVPGIENVKINIVDSGFSMNNPTPYFISVVGVDGISRDKSGSDFSPVMIPPKSSASISGRVIKENLVVTIINDFGAQVDLNYKCSNKACILSTIPKQNDYQW